MRSDREERRSNREEEKDRWEEDTKKALREREREKERGDGIREISACFLIHDSALCGNMTPRHIRLLLLRYAVHVIPTDF